MSFHCIIRREWLSPWFEFGTEPSEAVTCHNPGSRLFVHIVALDYCIQHWAVLWKSTNQSALDSGSNHDTFEVREQRLVMENDKTFDPISALRLSAEQSIHWLPVIANEESNSNSEHQKSPSNVFGEGDAPSYCDRVAVKGSGPIRLSNCPCRSATHRWPSWCLNTRTVKMGFAELHLCQTTACPIALELASARNSISWTNFGVVQGKIKNLPIQKSIFFPDFLKKSTNCAGNFHC